MSKRKRFKLITTITLIFTFLLTNIKVFAVEINSTDAESYLNYDSPTWGKVLPIGNHRYYAPDLRTCYCLNTGALNPTGQDYTEEIPLDGGIETIIYWGYPARDGSQFGVTADEYRYCTQLAIWAYQKEAGLSRGLDRTRLQDGTGSLSRLKPVIDFLVEKGLNKELPTFFEVTPSNIVAHQEGDYFVSEPIKLKSDYTFSDAKVTIKSSSNPELKDIVKIKDMDGDERNTYNSNESFRVYIPIDAETGDIKIDAKATVDLPASLAYATPVEGKQDMSLVNVSPQAMNKDNVTVSWTGLNGAVQVIKKGDDGKLLTGAKFVLKSTDGSKIAETASENGKAVFNDIKPADYILEETEAPTGYLITNPVNVTVKPNKVSTVEMTDTQIKGKIQILKIDGETQKPLKGAEFEVKNTNGERVKTITTDENGIAETGVLPFAEYVIKEIKAPDKYTLNGKEYPVSITKHMETVKLTVANTKKNGSIEIVKKGDDGKLLEGAEFNLEDTNGKVIATQKSNKDGKVVFSDLKEGNYVIKEVNAPKGYNIVNPVNVEVKADEVTKLDLTDKATTGKLLIKKVDIATGKEVPGAKIKVTCTEGLDKGKSFEFVSTDKEQEFTLKAGKYEYVEIQAPKGYELNKEIGKFEITKEGQVVKCEVKDKATTGKLLIKKVDVATGKEVPGAKIKVTCTEGLDKGKSFEFVSTDKEQEFTLKAGKYEYVETQAPKGYELNKEVGKFEITKEGQVVKCEVKDKATTGKLLIKKVDVATGKEVSGAKIKVTCTEGLDKGKSFEFVSTDKEQEFDLKAGKYEFVETQAPKGYELNKEVGKFEITKEGQIVKCSVKDSKTTGKLIFKKVDSKTGEGLDGAEIKLVCTEGLDKGKEITFTSKKEGNELDLLAGKYVISELKAPEGYELTKETKEFTVNKQGEVVNCTLDNNKFEIVKTGSSFDVNALIPFGIILVAGGLGALILSKKRKLS
ncbi:SpaA isopeptide-forming pilin-related protein [Clostridium perfringens]|uniref:SpaA isopeptide-forming pilin-related protein n=1 Tax=Clostridium perfringens TaxID=1502 RepID=UPI0013E30D7D|nr:SpaA isopeptide-forming pilin-related protein [Clostridium perfringens]MBI6018508.1 Cys-Gln thioester bond-forming surface protein [Clostridium perfringens]MDK0931471.1 SpaA isopeptide-forming pilin-related protein [Clostridium perfringens]MDM0998949.1 SpaA isopeptide-forming pilin-related protein [Clostridium perfringens]MDT7932818.1 SpaA isopeptide-forming pilin-related protein [Clostridium perfringens]MDT7957006.1 SpaA isopeptide-forming pilin-related protein [Clostridium perfringens]